MKLAITLGSPDISGGTYVIFEHAFRAKNKGIDVYIVTEEKVEQNRLEWHPEAKSLKWITYDDASSITFDVAIATWWRTVYELHRIKAVNYVYFVQSIESRFYKDSEKPLKKLVEATYMLPLIIITEAKWIKKYLEDNYDRKVALVENGIRKDIYTEDGESYAKRQEGLLRVLIEGPIDVPFKNVKKTIEIVRNSLADEVWLLTSSKIASYEGVDKVFSQVPIFDTPKIYRSCDIIVKLSYVEGMFGPPLEMFHCGGTAITYDVTGHDEYIVNGTNALVAKTDCESDVIEYINSLKKDRSLLSNYKNGARNTACLWPSWEESSSKFIEQIHNISKSDGINQHKLEKLSKFYFDFYVIAEDYKNELEGNRKEKMKRYIKRIPCLYKCLKFLKRALK